MEKNRYDNKIGIVIVTRTSNGPGTKSMGSTRMMHGIAHRTTMRTAARGPARSLLTQSIIDCGSRPP